MVTNAIGRPAPRAGLPGRRAWVFVGPPLSASGASEGSTPTMLPSTPSTSEWPTRASTRLLIARVTVPIARKSWAVVVVAVLSAMIVLISSPIVSALFEKVSRNTPPASRAVLEAMVVLAMESMLSSKLMPPPSPLVLLPDGLAR